MQHTESPEEKERLDQASQIIADARAECMRLGVDSYYISKVMLDEAALGFMAGGLSLSEIQKIIKKYGKRDLVRFYSAIVKAAKESKLPPMTT